MGKGVIGPGSATAVIFALIGAALILFYSDVITYSTDGRTLPEAGSASRTPLYNPPAPEDAPASIKAAVIRGHDILRDTRQTLGEDRVASGLGCSDCHFFAGLTDGGKGKGISLVGVGVTYPAYDDATGGVITLAERVNRCLTASVNAPAIDTDGEDMKAIVTYLNFISTGLPLYGEIPWLGLDADAAPASGDNESGDTAYAAACAKCHGDGGAGTEAAPPLWGDRAFTMESPLASASALGAFVTRHMPYGNPSLTDPQSADIAAYLATRPRPAARN